MDKFRILQNTISELTDEINLTLIEEVTEWLSSNIKLTDILEKRGGIDVIRSVWEEHNLKERKKGYTIADFTTLDDLMITLIQLEVIEVHLSDIAMDFIYHQKVHEKMDLNFVVNNNNQRGFLMEVDFSDLKPENAYPYAVLDDTVLIHEGYLYEYLTNYLTFLTNFK